MKKILIGTALAVSLIATAGIASADRGHRGWHAFMDISELDANGDGTITKDELAAQSRARFDEMDTDNNGSLSGAELAAAFIARMEQHADKIGERGLAHLDDDENGAVSYDELQQVSKTERIFNHFDRNDDGQLDAEEVAKMEAKMQKRHKKGWWGRGSH